MAEKRMFSNRVIDTDEFLEMPATAQMLYFHLSMNADDDGFVGKPKTIMRMCRASQDDLTVLLGKQFVISFDTGVIVIRHWKIHNFIRKDTYHPTIYEKEKEMLSLDKSDAYSLEPQDEYVTSPLQVRNESVTSPLRVRDESVTSPLQVRNESVTSPLRVRDESVTSPLQVRNVDKNSIEKVREDKVREDKKRKDKGREDKTRKEDLFETLLPSYQISEPLADKIREYLRYRKEQHRFTFQEVSLNAFLKKAEKAEQQYGSSAVMSCFDKTISNGWKGVFYESLPKPDKPKEESFLQELKNKYRREGT